MADVTTPMPPPSADPPAPAGRPPPQNAAQALRVAAGPFALAALGAGACYWAAGPSLGLLFGGVGFATLLLPPLLLAEDGWVRRMLATAAVIDGVGVVWLVAAIGGNVSLGQWLACYLVLAAYGAALAGLALLLLGLRVPALAASALTIIAGLLWLSWPVWLAPWLYGASGEVLAGWLVPAHPLFAINRPVQHLGIWTQQGLAYRVVTLGQHVSYRLPASVVPAVILHLTVGAGMVLLAQALRCRTRPPFARPEVRP